MLRALGEQGVRVLVIDDNSPDGTGRLADRLAQELEYVDVLHRPRKEGLGPAYIADLRPCKPDHRFGPDDLAPHLKSDLRDKIVLLNTGWGQKRAKSDEWLHHAPMLGHDGARWLAERQIRGVGIDYYSIGDATVHETLLSKNIWIVEELNFPAEVLDLPVNRARPPRLERWTRRFRSQIRLKETGGRPLRLQDGIPTPRPGNREVKTRPVHRG